MFKDKEAQRVANREANKRYREKQKGITPDPVIPDKNVIPCVIPKEAKKYPDVLHALVDPVKRRKLQAICDSLNTEIHTFEGRKLNLLGEVRYGIHGPTVAVCAQWLKATETVPQT